jgi:hypothetical protein
MAICFICKRLEGFTVLDRGVRGYLALSGRLLRGAGSTLVMVGVVVGVVVIVGHMRDEIGGFVLSVRFIHWG